jgi:hypothetical protein
MRCFPSKTQRRSSIQHMNDTATPFVKHQNDPHPYNAQSFSPKTSNQIKQRQHQSTERNKKTSQDQNVILLCPKKSSQHHCPNRLQQQACIYRSKFGRLAAQNPQVVSTNNARFPASQSSPLNNSKMPHLAVAVVPPTR